MDEIALRYQLTLKEYTTGWRSYLLDFGHFWIKMSIAIFYVVLAIPLGQRSEEFFFLGGFLFFSGWVVILILLTKFFVIPRIMFRKYPRLREEMSFVFSESAIALKTNTVEARLDWRLYNKFVEKKDVVVLYYGGNEGFTVIPKRALTTENLLSFKELLERKIPSK